MTSGLITSWQIDGETEERVTDFIFLGLKSLQMVTVAVKLKDICSWKKSYNKPRERIKKQRHYFANKSLYSQSYGFSSGHVWMWELDHKDLDIKHQRIDAFELWCWRRLLRVPWNARRSNQSILKEINEDLFCIVLLCILATTSYLLLLLGPYHFCPFSFFLNLNLFILIGG